MDQQAAVNTRRDTPRRLLALRLVPLLLLLTCVAAMAAPRDHASRPDEYDVKAAYLFNFGKFTRFPADAGPRSSFDICVLGRDDFKGRLRTLVQNEQVNGLPERVVHLQTAAAARGCAILYVSSSEAARVDAVLHELGEAPVLTVSDMPHFVDRGGMVEFQTVNNHVRFSVSLDAVGRANLGLSSELLRVALEVKRGGRLKGGL